RLLPEDAYDTQPLENTDRGFALVADMRLDNREDLIAEMGIADAQAGMLCDAALLLAAFARWDEECCEHLVGYYAVAVWDAQAVRSRLRGVNGAIAAHLSSGFDSAAVATTAARLLAPSCGKVVAFTAVPRAGYELPAPDRRLGDEGPLAAATAAMHANIEHVL